MKQTKLFVLCVLTITFCWLFFQTGYSYSKDRIDDLARICGACHGTGASTAFILPGKMEYRNKDALQVCKRISSESYTWHGGVVKISAIADLPIEDGKYYIELSDNFLNHKIQISKAVYDKLVNMLMRKEASGKTLYINLVDRLEDEGVAFPVSVTTSNSNIFGSNQLGDHQSPYSKTTIFIFSIIFFAFGLKLISRNIYK